MGLRAHARQAGTDTLTRTQRSAAAASRHRDLEAVSEGLTASEWEQCVVLLQWFAEHDLDQHDAWRLDARDGPLFVRVNRNRGRRAAVTGARRGELAALRWTDIRWAEAGLLIERSYVMRPGSGSSRTPRPTQKGACPWTPPRSRSSRAPSRSSRKPAPPWGCRSARMATCSPATGSATRTAMKIFVTGASRSHGGHRPICL